MEKGAQLLIFLIYDLAFHSNVYAQQSVVVHNRNFGVNTSSILYIRFVSLLVRDSGYDDVFLWVSECFMVELLSHWIVANYIVLMQ